MGLSGLRGGTISKELFGKEFGNLEFTDEYSFHIWYQFLERDGQDHANDIDNADATVVHEVAPGVYHKQTFFNHQRTRTRKKRKNPYD